MFVFKIKSSLSIGHRANRLNQIVIKDQRPRSKASEVKDGMKRYTLIPLEGVSLFLGPERTETVCFGLSELTSSSTVLE